MERLTGKPKELKKINKSLILASIKNRKTATRSEIVKDTKISHTTVRIILNELIEDKEIISIGLDESSGGRRAERYEINLNKRSVLAISMEKGKAPYNIVNVMGEVINAGVLNWGNREDILSGIEEIYEDHKNIKAIGISVPGVVTTNGYVTGLGLDDWKEISITNEIKKKFQVSVLLENDLNAATIGFYSENEDIGNNLVYLSFTTLGAGAGIIINGELLKGNNGYAGEVGIIPIRNTYLNDLLFKDLDEEEYASTIVDTMKIISSLINPKTIVLGGNYFRNNLSKKIINKYIQESNIKAEIVLEDKEKNYSLIGITSKTIKSISEEIKIIVGGDIV